MNENITNVRALVKEFLPNICLRLDDMHDKYKTKNEFDNDRVIFLIDDLSSLMEGIGIIKEHYPKLDVYEFNEKVNLLVEAFEAKDYPLFFDIILYELKPLLEYWNENI